MARVTERAMMNKRSVGTLALIAFMWPSIATAAELESRYYIIETNLSPERAAFVGKVMDATGKAYHGMFRGFRGSVRQKMRVRVFATKEGYLAAFARFCGEPIENSRGIYCTADRAVYAYDGDGLERILKHECLHQFVDHVIGGPLPTWTNEGLAVYFEEGTIDEGSGQLGLGRVPAWRLKVLRAAQKQGTWIPVGRLLTISGQEWSDTLRQGSALVQYSEVWLLCHFLIHGEGGAYTKLFERYLGLVDEAVGGEPAFKRVFGSDFAPLENNLRAYLDGLKADKSE